MNTKTESFDFRPENCFCCINVCYQLDERKHRCRVDGSEVSNPHAQCCDNFNKSIAKVK